jgi:hypothetical protein
MFLPEGYNGPQKLDHVLSKKVERSSKHVEGHLNDSK